MQKGKYTKTLAMDLLTGEAVGQIVPIQRNILKREINFYMGDQKLSETLAKDKELRGQPMSVLLYMLSKVENGNYIAISQKKISEELDIHRVRVSEAIKRLLKKEIILIDKESTVRGCYILNPEYFWKGEREKAIKRKKRNEK